MVAGAACTEHSHHMTNPQQPDPDQPPKRDRTKLIVAGVAAGALLLVVATVAVTLAVTAGSNATSSRTIHVNGLLRLDGFESSVMDGSGGCTGTGGYDDIHGGVQVTVTDAGGTVIGVGQLADGSKAGGSSCVFTFAIQSVPAGKSFYGVSVSHRGTIQYTEAQMKGPLELTLGN